ncbi:MAG: response regulator [Verrucomicrobia bacterium]|nr:response regulator [Verrucomicrobiota bacterium]
MPDDPVRLGKSTPELREAFRRYEDSVAVDNVRRALALGGVFILAVWALDWVVFPEYVQEFLLIRATCAAVLGCIFLSLGPDPRPGVCYAASWCASLFPMVSICLMISITGGGNSVYYAGLNTILVGLSLVLRWTFVNSLGVVAVCFLSYAASVWFSPTQPEFTILFNNSTFLFVTATFVLAGCYFYEKLRFSEFALRAEVEDSRRQLESSNKQLSELDEAKTRFFANISHELRTPLTVMLGISERMKSMVAQQPGDDTMTEMVSMLEQNGLRLLKLIDDLLDLVRFDTGHADVVRQPTRIADHLDGLLRSLRHLAEQDRVLLLWKCDSESDLIELDRDKFDKILLNLVMNAIKFTPSGGSIEVVLRAENGRMELAVEDSGVGIPPEVLPRIFERFWQVDTSSTRKFQGAGIGLALVRSLAEAMGGSVGVASELGKGTKFTVAIPAAAVSSEAPLTIEDDHPLQDGGKIADLHRRAAMSIPGKVALHAPTAEPSATHEAPVIGRQVGGGRPLVLVADDEPDIRRFLRMQMRDVDVIEASDGAEALELARLRRPQLALLDFMMPEMDGVTVCRNIRDHHSTRGIAVIILTARADEQTKLAALQAGANDFLTKPFSSAELALRLESQIAMARIRREITDLNIELQAALEQIKESEVLMLRNEKLSALGRMSAGIIHEINNPLNYAGAGIHALYTFAKALPESERPDFEEIVNDIRDGIDRVSQIVIDLRKFTRDDQAITSDADLVDIITQARRMISHQIGKDITFSMESPKVAPVRGNPNQLVQVFINLFHNAIDAIHQRLESDGGEPGRLAVTVEPSGPGWVVSVRDNGIGIPPENLQKIFDPFFTSKEVGKGVGLGLSIIHQILRNHKAPLEVDSRPGQHTCFRIAFPGPFPADEDSSENSALDRTGSFS